MGTQGTHGRGRWAVVAVALLLFAVAFGFGWACYDAIELGLGDKKQVDLFGWIVERRVGYQVGFVAAGLNLIAAVAAAVLPRRRLLTHLLVAVNVAAAVFLWTRSDTILSYRTDTTVDAAAYTRMPDTAYGTPDRAARLIDVTSAAEAEALRKRLIGLVWRENKRLPAGRLPDTVERDVAVDAYQEMPGLARIDRLTLDLPKGYTAVAYHLVPNRPSGRLVLYHHGHVGDIFSAEAVGTLSDLVAAGHAVTALSMPHRAPNRSPQTLVTAAGEEIPNVRDHQSFAWLESDDFSPLRLFLEPVIVAINQGLADGYTAPAVIGLSGGGWTVTVAAALDSRIRASYPVAGSLPFHLVVRAPNSVQDWEQSEADIYRHADYLDLYVLGAAGEGRRQIQILNQFDSCCFRGIGARGYGPAVAEAARRLGGRYDLVILPEHDHRLSPEAMEIILEDLAGAAG